MFYFCCCCCLSLWRNDNKYMKFKENARNEKRTTITDSFTISNGFYAISQSNNGISTWNRFDVLNDEDDNQNGKRAHEQKRQRNDRAPFGMTFNFKWKLCRVPDKQIFLEQNFCWCFDLEFNISVMEQIQMKMAAAKQWFCKSIAWEGD